MNYPIIALPGGVMPAAIRYAPLQSALGSDTKVHTKDLEVYAAEAPPANYTIDLELAGLERFADKLSADRFHLVGYSGGGFVSLAFAGAHPDRLISLAVFEPARVPGPLSSEEIPLDRELRQALAGKDGSEFMRVFVTRQVRPGVEVPPPSGPPEPWMRTRPAGLAAMMKGISDYAFDRNRFRTFGFPVLYAYGDQTSEIEEVKVSILSALLPDLHVRRFAGVHHFVPPDRIYTADHVDDLRALWARAERRAGVQQQPAVLA